jgi:hypothetical protein
MTAKPKDDAPPIRLTLKSKYHVRSLASREAVLETRGTFRGVVSVGTIDGLAMELDESHADLKGKTRVIPTHMVLSIDILEAVTEEEEKREDSVLHYG